MPFVSLRPVLLGLPLALALGACGLTAPANAPDDRVPFNGQDLFLSGGNVAWIHFARDVGPGETDLERFDEVFGQLHEAGGNAMRLWLHTTGDVTPAYSTTEVGVITGPGEGTVEDLRAILDTAWEHDVGLILCLWSFDMLQGGRTPEKRAQNKALLQSAALTQTYVEAALVPMVEALAGHPAILAWEIFNEPEGMTEEFGWTDEQGGDVVTMRDVQRFVNLTAGAIHRADPGALVTNGSWSFRAHSDVLPPDTFDVSVERHYYDDAELVEIGGDPDGTLDFYTVHYYEWGGTRLSPFHHPKDYWEVGDKPLVVAEFFMGTGTPHGGDGDDEAVFGVPQADLYRRLYETGYAGALGWQWFRHPHGAEGVVNWPRMLDAARDLRQRHPEAVTVSR